MSRPWPRSPFVAIVLEVDPSSSVAITGKAANISLGGCHIDSQSQIATGTTVAIELVHGGESFHAIGEIVYLKFGDGMGIRFTRVDDSNHRMLARWIEALQTEPSHA